MVIIIIIIFIFGFWNRSMLIPRQGRNVLEPKVLSTVYNGDKNKIKVLKNKNFYNKNNNFNFNNINNNNSNIKRFIDLLILSQIRSQFSLIS